MTRLQKQRRLSIWLSSALVGVFFVLLPIMAKVYT